MLSIDKLKVSELKGIRFILTDFDDTLTFEGVLPSVTLSALEALEGIGVKVIPVTGGCAGWSDMMARTLPISGVITEGGSIFIEKNGKTPLKYHYCAPEEEIRTFQEETLNIVNDELRENSALILASDQKFRISDVAIDFAQDIVPPAYEEKDQLLVALKARGLNAKASSIHINITHHNADKWIMSKKVLTEFFNLSREELDDQVLVVGDAPNDQTLFEKFRMSVGVANIKRYQNELVSPPNYVTHQAGGFGFSELAQRIIDAKTDYR